jgi:signal transduction histidine kinase
MAGMIKLLDKPLKAFTTYSLIVLLCSIPAYFLIIDLIWVHEINKHNQIVAAITKKNIAALRLNDTGLRAAIETWNRLQPEAKIQRVSKLLADSAYNVYRKSNHSRYGAYDRFEGLVSFFYVNGKPYSLTVESNVEESYETIVAITGVTVLFFIILLVGFIKLNKRISKKLWKPFYETLAQIKAFDLSGHTRVELENSNIAEFEQLNTSIGKLLDRNIAVFRQQKEFTENASHELQTPLAIVQSKLDLLLQDEEITSKQSHIIEQANYALSRVSRINKNLLLLAKIENQQFLEKQPINMSETLSHILDLLAGLLGERTIDSSMSPDCIVEGNPMLVEIMLTNLLMNTLRHAEKDARITLVLTPSELLISNPGHHPLDESKLFRRFSAASSQTPGSGLGLSIIKEICNRYGWAVGYRFSEQQHVFSVGFLPKA